MSLNISTNTAALRAGSYLASNNTLLQRSLDRLASGKKISSPVDDPGSLAVSMKLSASINRLAGAQNNVQNAISFLEVQDGMLDTVGKIIDRMSELKGLASQDPMKSRQDRESYNNEFKDLQVQLYSISQQKFNGVSMFAQYNSHVTSEALFLGSALEDNTISIFTSTSGGSGPKVSVHKSMLLSALTIETYGDLKSSIYTAGSSSAAVAVGIAQNTETAEDGSTLLQGVARGNSRANGSEERKFVATFATASGGELLDLDDISVGVITKALENVSYLRSQNGGTQSRLTFNMESLTQQKTNMRAALGRISDVDIAEESTNLAKYSILNQAAASMLAQANASTDVALMLLR
jgi:flagellin-like hook-associated protein FlgL